MLKAMHIFATPAALKTLKERVKTSRSSWPPSFQL